MPVTTQPNVELIVEFDTHEYQCQIIDVSFKPPGVGTSTVTETACPDGIAAEPGAISPGSLTGSAFTDSRDTGITWILAQAHKANATISYRLVFFDDLGPTVAMQYTGEAKVNTFGLDFSKPGINKHAVDLSITSATLARPTAA